MKRFHAEVEAAANLDHPGIVPIFEVGQHEGQHYFSMGFVEGSSLAARVADGPRPPREAADMVRAVAEAVQYAHDKGVIHRDLKPANVLLKHSQKSRGKSPEQDEGGRSSSSSDSGRSTLDFQPMVTDFGLAKRVEGDSELTASGQILGTPGYMPPEQAAGKLEQIGPHSDVYALGAILYACLTGRPPFQADNPLDTLMQVLEREPVSPCQLNPSIARDLETICLKAMAKEPARRYPRAGDLAADLRRWLEGLPIMARPGSRVGVRNRATPSSTRPLLGARARSMLNNMSDTDHVTQILNSIERGDSAAAERLLPLVYHELRHLAARKLDHEPPGQTLQSTALVHEAYLRLVDVEHQQKWSSRGHFFAAAAEAMRRILVESARRKQSLKRGGGRKKFDVDQIQAAVDAPPDELLDLDHALAELAEQHPEKAQLVKLRFFAGLTIPEAAEALGVSPSTADRHWSYARAWLFRRLKQMGEAPGA